MLTKAEIQQLLNTSHSYAELNTLVPLVKMDPDFYGYAYDGDDENVPPEPVQPSSQLHALAPKNGLRVRRFVFTLNNYTDLELRKLKSMPDVRWMIIGKETAPGTGTKHLQGAVCLTKQIAFRSLKNMIGLNRAHIQIMRGSPQQSREYCSKQDPHPYERGSLPEPGKRSDLDTAAEYLKGGMNMKQLARTMPATVAHYAKGLTHLRALLLDGRRDKPCVIWLWGETGTGKTRSAFELGNLYGSCWMSNDTLRWMDGYDGQRVAILDDFRPDDCPFNLLLKLLDFYPLLVQYKGGYVDWIPEIILITSPMPPDFMYASKPKDDIAQLLRRIDFTFEIPKDKTPNYLLNAIKDYIVHHDTTLTMPGGGDSSGSEQHTLECVEEMDLFVEEDLARSRKEATMVDSLLEEDKGNDTVPMSDSEDDIFDMD